MVCLPKQGNEKTLWEEEKTLWEENMIEFLFCTSVSTYLYYKNTQCEGWNLIESTINCLHTVLKSDI